MFLELKSVFLELWAKIIFCVAPSFKTGCQARNRIQCTPLGIKGNAPSFLNWVQLAVGTKIVKNWNFNGFTSELFTSELFLLSTSYFSMVLPPSVGRSRRAQFTHNFYRVAVVHRKAIHQNKKKGWVELKQFWSKIMHSFSYKLHQNALFSIIFDQKCLNSTAVNSRTTKERGGFFLCLFPQKSYSKTTPGALAK